MAGGSMSCSGPSTGFQSGSPRRTGCTCRAPGLRSKLRGPGRGGGSRPRCSVCNGTSPVAKIDSGVLRECGGTSESWDPWCISAASDIGRKSASRRRRALPPWWRGQDRIAVAPEPFWSGSADSGPRTDRRSLTILSVALDGCSM